MIRCTLVALLALAPLPTLAQPITVEFEAIVTEVVDQFALLPGVEVGSALTGSYLYDDKVTGTPLAGETSRVFSSAGIAQAGFEFRVESNKFNLRDETQPPVVPLTLTLSNTVFPQGDSYSVRWSQTGRRIPFPQVGPVVTKNSVDLGISGPGLLEEIGDAIPAPPPLGDAVAAVFEFTARREIPFCPPNALCPVPLVMESRLRADLITIRIVPEPAGFPLLGVATAALRAAWGRRSHARWKFRPTTGQSS